MTLEREVKEVLKKELEASEKLGDITIEYSPDEVDETFINVAKDLVKKSNDPERQKTILIILFRIGEAMESQAIVSFTKDKLTEWKEIHG